LKFPTLNTLLKNFPDEKNSQQKAYNFTLEKNNNNARNKNTLTMARKNKSTVLAHKTILITKKITLRLTCKICGFGTTRKASKSRTKKSQQEKPKSMLKKISLQNKNDAQRKAATSPAPPHNL